MVTYYPELAQRVRSQRDLQPALYGEFDFDRAAGSPGHRARRRLGPAHLGRRPRADPGRRPRPGVDQHGNDARRRGRRSLCGADEHAQWFAGLIDMLKTGLPRRDRGGAARAPGTASRSSPPWRPPRSGSTSTWYVRAPGRSGSRRRSWLRSSPAGRSSRPSSNTYAALPMALTGALSGKRAARRVNETASFFAVTTLPGALERYGPGFEAAAMVRLMHSMVRYNALKKSDKWDLPPSTASRCRRSTRCRRA